MTFEVLGGDARQIGALFALQSAIDLDADLGVRVRGGRDRGRTLDALHRGGTGATHVPQSGASYSRIVMQVGGWAADRMILDRQLIVRLGAPGLLRPE